MMFARMTRGSVARGIGDLYLSGKIQLRDPSARGRRVGFSTTPLVEILSYAPRPDSSRFGWAIPGNIVIRGTRWRTFGSAGYSSQGALFASGAVEAALSNRAWVTGSISRSHSIEKDDLSVALGLTQEEATQQRSRHQHDNSKPTRHCRIVAWLRKGPASGSARPRDPAGGLPIMAR